MLHYGGIDFEPHHGPDVWSKEYVELYSKVYPNGDAEATPPGHNRLAKRKYVFRWRYILACLLGHTEMSVPSSYELLKVVSDICKYLAAGKRRCSRDTSGLSSWKTTQM